MIRLDLNREPAWLDLAPGVRVLVEPLTTALMMAARSDPGVEGLPETATDEDRALVWDLVLRLGGQLRAVPGAALGWDLSAALALAAALGVDPRLAAEVLPEIEPIAVAKVNQRAGVRGRE